MDSVRPAGQMSNSNEGSTRRALHIHTTFSDLDCISRSQQCQTVFTEILCFNLIKLKLCMNVDYIK